MNNLAIEKLIKNATSPIYLDSDNVSEKLSAHIEAIIIICFLKNPSNEKFNHGNFFKILEKSDFFLEVIESLEDKFKENKNIYFIEQVRKLLEQIFYLDINEEKRDRILEIETFLEYRRRDLELDILEEIEKDPSGYFEKQPRLFLLLIGKMKAIRYYDLILDNNFVDVVDIVVTKNDLSEEELTPLLKILGTNLAVYTINDYENDYEMSEEEALCKQLLGYKDEPEETIADFDFDFCNIVYQKLTDMIETKKEKRKY